jgi:nitroreductase
VLQHRDKHGTAGAVELEETIVRRRSVRAFLPREVPREVLLRIFDRAQRAPSWCNIQPWRVFLASGRKRAALTSSLLAAVKSQPPGPDVPFPGEYPEPYATHRKACGRALYEAMGVERHDVQGREQAWHRNFVAFDAPHVAIVGIDRRFELYAALDVGCWLQTVLLLATSEGVATCAQASLSLYPAIARAQLDIPEGIKILFGLGLGYEDNAAPANACRTTRDPIDSNVTFRD